MAKATVHNLDFTNVKDGGSFNTKRIEAGDYLAKIVKVEDSPVKSGDNKGAPQYLFTIKLVDHSTSVFPYYCQLTEKMLWKLRNILVAAGKSVPKRKAKVNPNDIVGKLIGVVIEDDEHEGKERSRIEGVFPASDLPDAPDSADEPDEEEEEEYADAPLEEDEAEEEGAAPEADEEEEDEEEAEITEADRIAGMSRNELKAAIVELQADFRAKKSQSDDDLRDVLKGLQASPDESDEDDEEEEEAPAPKKTAKKTTAKPAASKAKKKTTKKAVEEVTDDELDELDIDAL